MNIGNKIKDLRNQRGVTQDELAKVLNISNQAVSKWENGGSPDIELIPEIAKYFNVTIDYLFDYTVNDCNGIDGKVLDYMASLPSENEKFKAMFKLGYIMEIGSYGDMDLNDFDIEQILLDGGANSQYICDAGTCLLSIKNENKFFSVFPRPESGYYNSLIKNKKQQIDFFKDLGNSNFYNALILIYSRKDSSFTENLFVNELKIDLNIAKDIILKLKNWDLISVTKLELNDQIISTYSLKDNPAVIGLFSFIDMIINRPKNFYLSIYNPHKNYFKKEFE